MKTSRSESNDAVSAVNSRTKSCSSTENLCRSENPDIDVKSVRTSDKPSLGKTKLDVVQPALNADEFADGQTISEAGRFALAAVYALSLNHLFSNKWDEDFCLRSMKYVVVNLQLPRRVEPMMVELMRGNGSHSTEPYIFLLNSEPYFQKEEKVRNMVYNFITLAVHDGKYDARWRVLIQYIAALFRIERFLVDEFERKLVDCLWRKAVVLSEEEKQKATNRKLSAKAKRYAWIGLATIGGGALIGVTGGIVAPLIGAGLGNLLGASAVFATLTTGAGGLVIGSLFGVAGGGLTGYKMHKRVGDIEEFEFHELNPIGNDENLNAPQSSMNIPKELHITIVISGWIKNNNKESYTKPWLNLLNGREQYYLKYESSYLMELGKAMEYIFSFVASVATQQVLRMTVLSGIMSAVSWPAGLVGLSSVIDNPWGVCLRRSAQVGKQLAEVLLARNQGHRPVTLVGYSLGARVIYYCLREMSERKNCEGIIQDVILIGAPCTAQASEWAKFSRVVAGRIINGYCRGDWLLRFLYRTLSIAVDGVAGLQNIELNNQKICNVDLTDIVAGHSEYPERMTEILSFIGIPLAVKKTTSDSETSLNLDDSLSCIDSAESSDLSKSPKSIE